MTVRSLDPHLVDSNGSIRAPSGEHRHASPSWNTLVALAALFLAVWLAPPQHAFQGLANYLPLHSFAETLSIVVAMMAFGVGWNAYTSARSGNLVILGCAFLATGLIDFAHMLSFQGMPQFVTVSGPEKAINFWLAARSLAAAALLVAALRPPLPFFSARTPYLLFAALLTLTAAVYWIGLWHAEVLPRTFIADVGLTAAKIAAEYFIVALLAAAAIGFYARLRRSGYGTDALMFSACVISVLSELCFTLYSHVTDVFNLLGHVYKVVAYGYIYRALFVESVKEPFERLRISETSSRRLAAIVESTDDAVLSMTPDGVITTWNAGAERLYGYRASEIAGRPISVLIPPERAAEEERIFAKVRSGQRVNHYQTVRLAKSAVPVDISLTLSPILDQSGRVIGISTTARDITDLRKAEDRLRAASLYARSLIEASLDPLVTISPQGKVTDVNRATEQATGIPREQLIGSDFADYFTDPAQARAGYEKVLSEGSVRDYALTLRHVAGRTVDVLYNATTYRNESGELQGVFAAARDITATKQAQQMVAVERQRLLEILELLPPYVLLLTPDYHEVFANRVFRERFGESQGKRCFEHLFGRSEPCEICETYKVLETKVPHTWVWTGPDGRTYDICDMPFVDSDGSPMILEIGIDITERQHAEAEIRALNETLEQRVQQRTTELEAANRELEAFAYSVSHDLRAPLRTIDGFSLALLEDCAEQVGPEGRDSLQRVRAASQRMGQLIDDILQLSRVSRSELERLPVDMSALAREVEADLRARDLERRVEFSVRDGLVVHADPRLLRQVLENLLGNAWKFTSRHPVARIELGATEVDGKHAYYVRDDGAGFDMRYVGKLFAPFVRLHDMEEFPGSGVGLAIVQRIVRRHGGRVWAEGAPERGATLYFTLE